MKLFSWFDGKSRGNKINIVEKVSSSGHFLDSTTASSKMTGLPQENQSVVGKRHCVYCEIKLR